MSISTNSSSVNGRGRGRGRGRVRNASTRSRNSLVFGGITPRNNPNENDEQNERDRNKFIASFKLNISAASSPVLVRNDIRKLGNNCFSDRVIREYFQNSNPHNINIQIKQIWKVHNVGHYAQFMQNNYDQVDNMLLWHGTTRQNLVSILQNNLQLPVSATNGHMFGPGIYFADRMSKSARYTDNNGPEVFLLCQVALGKKWRVYKAHPYTSAPGNYDTLKAVGKNVPNINGEKKFGEYCKVPCGRTVVHRDFSVRITTPLEYNEYIVFDQNRIRIKFIVHCERNGSGAYVTPTVGTTLRPVQLRPITFNNPINYGSTQNSSYSPSLRPAPTVQNQNSACVIL